MALIYANIITKRLGLANAHKVITLHNTDMVDTIPAFVVSKKEIY